jgi:hypothetical protein
LLWSKNAHKFGISTNEKNENYVDKYLTTNQSILKIEIHRSQIHQHKQTFGKTTTTNLLIPISKTIGEIYKILSPLNENDNNSNLCKITFQIFKKIVNMGLGVDISFDQF